MNTVHTGGYQGDSGLDIATVDTTGNIVLNMLSKVQRAFKGSAAIAANKTWSFSNITRAIHIPFFRFSVSVANVVQTLPANVTLKQGSAGDWNDATKQWTALDIGEYVMQADYDGTEWTMLITPML